jgi:hypothetical protein
VQWRVVRTADVRVVCIERPGGLQFPWKSIRSPGLLFVRNLRLGDADEEIPASVGVLWIRDTRWDRRGFLQALVRPFHAVLLDETFVTRRRSCCSFREVPQLQLSNASMLTQS